MRREVEDINGNKIWVEVVDTAGLTVSVVKHGDQIMYRDWSSGRFYPAKD